ncbi:ATP-dependent DNA helicase DinG [Rhodanobacter denitrificans]|uniref:ATP-dependent DNA helicase DinG n=1 Tax=Rhodanobacter denitrificans TaxID=666685 RepID=M4NI13_9GAMM|nr:ATP-dependent DNA helicase DinG [Rhodanobacter denitrificans]AGG90580.1 DNA helicase, Rad3 [Rhodanobacter denitrificans]UJM85963.1 ATP-dependent DNA helicase DinG [Rhodanobacter denitrificans]
MLADTTKDAIRAAYTRLKDGLPDFRARASQGRMIAEVAKALATEGGVAVIEAPTGTGKSMAYLIAGVAVARFQKKKLLIATATVALQEQLVQRDIPLYLGLNGIEAKVALAKGRGRYLCPRNLLMAANSIHDAQLGLAGFEADLMLWSKPPQPRDKQALAKLRDAFDRREWDGDMDSTPEPVSELLRPMITTSAGGCTNRKCGQFMACPFFAARRAVDDAEIIVANQDLVLADLTMPGEGDGGVDPAWGGVILPRPDDTLYVFDEAHHLPGKALDRGAAEVYMSASVRQLNRLGRQVHAAYSLTDKETLGRLALDAGDAKLQELSDVLEELEKAIRLGWLPDPAETEPMYRGSLGQLPEPWVEHARVLGLLTGEVQRWLGAVRRAVVEMTDGGPTQEALSRELGIALERIGRQAACWRAWSADDPDDAPPLARWVTLGADQQLVCHASAVSAAGLLREVLWGNASGVLLTSATLSAGGNFRGFADAVGLPDDAVTLSLPSPFDLAAQARLEVPTMRTLPDAREAHAEEISEWLADHLDWGAGNLVLFTSRAKLDRVLQKLPIAQVRKVRAQGSLGKSQLVAEHCADVEAGKGSTLFGLASFGEGLDLPGKLCETVVITQLPFAVPTDPVGATYAEWLESRGRNPFIEVSVPEATRLLTQYCGRLIRNESDCGRIVLLDRRVVTKRYGAGMLKALPPFRRVIERSA